MVEPGFPVVMVAMGQTMGAELAALGEAVRQHGANLVVIGDDADLCRQGNAWIYVPAGLPEWLTPLVAIIPGQLLAYHLAFARGGDPDRPRTIRKVTLTH